MRINSSIRKRGKRKKIEPLDIDITSLLDILTILLVFLLKSYNSSGVVLNVPEGISLPSSDSQSINTSGVMVQVSTKKIWVDDKIIYNQETPPSHTYDHGGRRIIPLFNELVLKKETFEQVEKSSPNAKKFSGIINLIIDKDIRYNFMRKIMYTCADAGFQKFKFVVMGREESSGKQEL